jgi:hypothetical protein
VSSPVGKDCEFRVQVAGLQSLASRRDVWSMTM